MKDVKIKNDFEECLLSLNWLKSNPRARRDSTTGFFVDVRKDCKKNEFFAMFKGRDCDVTVLDKMPNKRHILLMVKTKLNKTRFLLGHDERQLFVSPLNNESRATTISEAFEELKPANVVEAQRNKKIKVVRQGEWFFVPAPEFEPPKDCPILKKVDIRGVGRWSGNPHIADEIVRIPVIDSSGKPVDTIIYIRGKVRHGEHATVEFHVWHRVYRNIEMRDTIQIGFVD